jgi:glycerophosphoryl diester phosphodiesterase
VNVELKNPGRPPSSLRPGEALDSDALAGRTAVWRPFVERVLEVADGRGNDLLVSSFHEAALAATRELSDRPVAPLVAASVEDALEIADRYDAAAIHPPIDAVRGAPFFDASRFGDADVVAAAHEAGRAVNVWTVKTWFQTDRLAAAGVDGVISDYSTVGPRKKG